MTKYELKEADETKLRELENTSAFTIEGAGGNLHKWCVGLNEMLEQRGIGQVKEFYNFSGQLMNETYGLTSSNRYPDDLTFLSFPLDNLNIGKLAMFKLEFGARWLDDIVDNNATREQKEMEECYA